MSGQQLVLEAVQQKDASKKQSLLQKLFALWFDAFVYNQIWEDPRVDLEALRLDRHSRVLTISSGGCNALNYLTAGPESITAVDLNRHHIFLLRLKIAAARHLPAYEDFFAFFGEGRSERNLDNYRRFVAPHLDAGTRDFWESGSFLDRLRQQRRIDFFRRGGLYEHSRNAYFLRFFHRLSHLLGCRPEEVLTARSLDEQAALYDQHIAPFFESPVIKTVGKMPVTMFGLGIPPQQYEELRKDLRAGLSIIDVYKERVRRLAAGHPIADNYFAWQAFARRYDTEHRRAVPDYLKTENYEIVKQQAAKIRTRIGSVTDAIRQSEYGAFNRFVFLDAQDWMDGAALVELWHAVADRAPAGSRIIFRTAGARSPLDENLPKALKSKFTYEKQISAELFQKDRASIYGGFHLYILKQ